MARSKQKLQDEAILIYCRKCQEAKNASHFYKATDTFIDKNGFMSVCKECIEDIYNAFIINDKSMDKTILRICRILNVKFSEDALETTKKQLKTYSDRGTENSNVFGLYKSKLLVVSHSAIGDHKDSEDISFFEPSKIIITDPITDEDVEDPEKLKLFWGENFNYDDFVFLETELSEWKKTHKCDTKAEESLLKELCYKELEIRKARIEGKQTGNLVKEKQDLMKTASVDPSKASSAGSGRSQDTFSSFIKIIEQNEPADYYKDKELFKDFDNIDWYFKKYVTRPMKNFITQSRDFNVEKEDDDEEDGSIDSIIEEIEE